MCISIGAMVPVVNKTSTTSSEMYFIGGTSFLLFVINLIIILLVSWIVFKLKGITPSKNAIEGAYDFSVYKPGIVMSLKRRYEFDTKQSTSPKADDSESPSEVKE